MRLCLFVLRFLSNMEKIIQRWILKDKQKIEETFFLYDIDTQEIETLYA
jgi:hypothetical protein